MLNNPVKRETVKGVGAVGAVVAQDPVADVLVIVLGIAVEALGTFSQKRSKELFDSDDLKEGVVRKIKESDDFASFVLSVWQKHNLESNEDRRRLLKRFLEEEVYRENNDFENFSKIELILQNASLRSLKLLDIFYSDTVKNRIRANEGTSRANKLSKEDLFPIIQDIEPLEEEEIEYYLNELGGYSLISVLNNRLGGTAYKETRLGCIVIEYIKS